MSLREHPAVPLSDGRAGRSATSPATSPTGSPAAAPIVRPEAAARRQRLVGALLALCAVTIWGGWIVSTRHAVTGHFAPAAVGFVRFLVAAVLLAPWWLKVGLWPRGRVVPFLFCFFGAGGVFFLVVANAMRFVPAADVGPMLPGTMPLIVAAISVLVLKERLGIARAVGFACIALGVLTLGGRGLLAAQDGAWRGHALLLCGATMWAGYTLAFPRTRMSARELAGLVGLWSALLLAPMGVPGVIAGVRDGGGGELVQLVLVQGLLSGVVALVAFGMAIERLGSSRAAAFTGLVPALAAIFAVFLLGEHPDLAAIIGICATGAGVVLASGALRRGPAVPGPA